MAAHVRGALGVASSELYWLRLKAPESASPHNFLESVNSCKNMAPSKILVHNMEFSLMSYIRLMLCVWFVGDKVLRR